jgi:hypothetical protein
VARALSANSRKVLRELGTTAKSIDELRVRTGVPKKKLAKVLWHLRELGWVSVSEEVRKTPVFRRIRLRAGSASSVRRKRPGPSPHLAALQAAFGIRLPSRRAQARTVRPGRP